MSLLAIGFALMHAVAAQGDTLPPAPEPRPTTASAAKDGALDEPMIAALQLGTACGTYAVGVPLLSIASYGCMALSCGLCLTPAAAGYLGTWVGDRYGGKRAPAIWPIVAAYAGLLVSGLGLGIIYYAAFTGSSPVFVFGGAAGILAGFGASVVGVPAAYALTAEDKEPWDDGTELPGLLTPGHPAKRPGKKAAPKKERPEPVPSAPMPELPTPPLLEPQGLWRAMRF